MKTYEELVRRYRRRNRHNAADAAYAGLTYADELATQAGLLINSEPVAAVLDATGMVLPFVSIAANEGYKVLTGRKPASVGLWDSVDRMTKLLLQSALAALLLLSWVCGLPFLRPWAAGCCWTAVTAVHWLADGFSCAPSVSGH